MQPIEPLLPWDKGPERPRWTEKLRDGTAVLIRPVRREDAHAERAFIKALSPGARHNRFRGQVSDPTDVLIDHLTNIDYDRHVAFAAMIETHSEVDDTFIGVSRYSTSEDGSECEFAVTVLDEWQGRGLGTALMDHLIEVARSRGIRRMWSWNVAANIEMEALARHLGFERSESPDDPLLVMDSLWLSSAA